MAARLGPWSREREKSGAEAWSRCGHWDAGVSEVLSRREEGGPSLQVGERESTREHPRRV
jgi:hypothetical protein